MADARAAGLLLALLASCAAPPSPAASGPGADPARGRLVHTSEYQPREIEGWRVLVNRRLLDGRGAAALKLLETKLQDVVRAVPLLAVVELRKVPIWLGVDDGHAPGAEYHPSREWLAANGYNPDKAKGVEIGSAANFVKWSNEQPSMLLHELAHAYHDRVLGFDHAGIREAYAEAKSRGLYDPVLRWNGRRERAYAMKDEKEYFAEGSEAYFGTNDFYPFVRAELKEHDPRLFRVLEEAWRPQ